MRALLPRSLAALAATGLFFALGVPAFAQADSAPPKGHNNSQEPPAAESEEATEEDGAWAEATDGATRYEGAFTFWLKEEDKTILLELPVDNLERLFYVQATLNTGFTGMGAQAGDPLGTTAVEPLRWHRRESMVWLMKPNLKFRWTKDDPLGVASSRSFPEAILGGYKVEAEDKEKKLLLLDVTTMFDGELFLLSEVVNSMGQGFGLDTDKTFVERIRSFEKNTVLRMHYHYIGNGGGGDNLLLELLGLSSGSQLADDRSLPLMVTYNLWYPEPSGYMPRLADPRIGYFTQDFFNVARIDERDRTERYIMRYHLVKKDPQADVSEPVEPIVWYIDNSVPKEYRAAVRDGILLWNAAFEKAGFKNALVVKQAPDDDPEWDHADGRFNVIRWTMSEDAAYGVALFRTDPYTGQVLNAAVTIDANYPAFMKSQYPLTTEIGDATRSRLLSRASTRGACCPTHDREAREAELSARLARLGWSRLDCNKAEGMGERAAVAWNTLRAVNSPVKIEEFMHAFIVDLVAHEVGHCLGLRHNFGASTNLTTEQLLNDELVKAQGVTASVMDYLSINTMAVLRGTGYFFNPVVGPYDVWAIQYGYTPVLAASPAGEKYALDLIARRSGEPGHLYLTDGDADGVNPLAVRWDLAADTVNWVAKNAELERRLREYAIRTVTQPGQSYEYRNGIIMSTYARTFMTAMDAARFIGGLEYRRQFRGDIGERPTLMPVSPADQRAAMRVIAQTLSKETLDVPQSVLFGMSGNENDEDGANNVAPLRSMLGTFMSMLLVETMSADRVGQIAENEFKMQGDRDRYTLSEHYNLLFGIVFREVGADRPILPLRRDLQRFMVDALIEQARSPGGFLNDDVRAITNQGLRRLQARFLAARDGRNLDEISRLHLQEMADQIKRFFDREVVEPN